jgi:putative transposase
MKRKQFSEEQIIGILKEAEAGAVVTDLCRRHGMSSATYYAWKAKFGGLEVSDAKRLRALDDENARPKRLLSSLLRWHMLLMNMNKERRNGYPLHRR